MKEETLKWINRNTDDHKRPLWTITWQQTRKPGVNGSTPRNIQPTQTESQRNRKCEQIDNKSGNWVSNHKTSQQSQSQDQMASLMHSIKLKGDFITILYKLFKKIEEEGPLPSTSHKASIILIPNPEKNTARKKTTDWYPWCIQMPGSSTIC